MSNVPPSDNVQKPGYGKAGASLLSVVLTNKLAPVLFLYVQHWFPALDQNTQIDLVDYAQAAIVGATVYVTPHNFVEAIKDGILFVKATLKTWKDAWDGKDGV